jgi:hypothetical protein
VLIARGEAEVRGRLGDGTIAGVELLVHRHAARAQIYGRKRRGIPSEQGFAMLPAALARCRDGASWRGVHWVAGCGVTVPDLRRAPGATPGCLVTAVQVLNNTWLAQERGRSRSLASRTP